MEAFLKYNMRINCENLAQINKYQPVCTFKINDQLYTYQQIKFSYLFGSHNL